MIELKTAEQIDIMHISNTIVHDVLQCAKDTARIGMSTTELDAAMKTKLSGFKGAKPAFLNYHGYPNVSCISVNQQVVHGIPGPYILKDGDLVSIDFGVYYKGFAGDSAISFIMGKSDNGINTKLMRETQRGLFAGIDKMVIGNRLHDIGAAIDNVAKSNGYGNVRGFCGHGIGRAMHENPSVFNYVEPKEPNVRLRAGMVLALEPMFCNGNADVEIGGDGWTVTTKNGSIAAHWELSIAVTNEGPRVLGTGFEKTF